MAVKSADPDRNVEVETARYYLPDRCRVMDLSDLESHGLEEARRRASSILPSAARAGFAPFPLPDDMVSGSGLDGPYPGLAVYRRQGPGAGESFPPSKIGSISPSRSWLIAERAVPRAFSVAAPMRRERCFSSGGMVPRPSDSTSEKAVLTWGSSGEVLAGLGGQVVGTDGRGTGAERDPSVAPGADPERGLDGHLAEVGGDVQPRDEGTDAAPVGDLLERRGQRDRSSPAPGRAAS